jgi:hypothetical protein
MKNGAWETTKAFQMPDELTVIAIGGCGKKLVSHLTDHTWFLKHYLREGKRLRINVMDTDSNQREDDIRKAESVGDTVAGILKNEEGMGGSVTMQYHFLPDLANVERISSLTGKNVIEQVKSRKAEPMINFWWMHDPDQGFSYHDLKKIDRNITDDFGGGVHRRRAISKAVFFKAITQGGDQFPSFQGHGPIVIVVGFGGGTGAGMFIDLARYIKGMRGEETKIWLFGILPAVGEGEKEQLNAAITLTEIEYLNLKEEKLFNYVILSSLSPTGSVDGGDRIREVVEFDEAFPYLLINSLYLPTADISAITDAKKEYSGLIFADSHIIEYPVEELISLKTEFEKIIKEIENLAIDRKRYLDVVAEFLTTVETLYPEGMAESEQIEITRDDINYLKKEVERLKKAWNNEIARDLNYQTSAEIETYIKNNFAEDLMEFDRIDTYQNILEYITKLKKFLQSGGIKLENETDRTLSQYTGNALAQLESMARLQLKILRIREPSARAVLLKIARGDEDLAQAMGDLSSRRLNLSTEIVEAEKKVQRRGGELDTLKAEQSELLGQAKSECNALMVPVSEYARKKEDIRAIAAIEDKFRDKLDNLIFRAREEVSRAKNKKAKLLKRNEWTAQVKVAEVQEYIDTLASRSGEDLGYLSDLTDSVVNYYYYSFLLEIANRMGLIDKVLGHDLDREMLKAEKNEKEDRIRRIAELHPEQIVIRDPFDIMIHDRFLSRDMERQLQTSEQNLLAPLASEFKLEYQDTGTLLPAFSAEDAGEIIRELKENLTGILEERYGYAQRIEQAEVEIDAIGGDKETATKTVEFLKNCEKRADESFEPRKSYANHLALMEAGFRNIEMKKKKGHETIEGLYMTQFGEINPNVLSLITEASDMSVLDHDTEGQKEIDKLLKIVNWKYKDLIDTRKLGLNNFSVSYGTGGTERWNFEKAALVIASPSRWLSDRISNKNDSFRRHLMSTLDLDSNNDAKVNAHNYTRPWEISLTFFAAASFLDNVAPLTTGGGYWEKYEKKQDNILHHVLFLQDGKYITRNQLLLLKEAARIADLESGTEADIDAARERIMSLYTMKEIPARKPESRQTIPPME